jgi:hypothetical protein
VLNPVATKPVQALTPSADCCSNSALATTPI